MSRQHTVQQGEDLVRIAHRYHFLDYRTIYEHPSNAEFRRLRPDPNLIYPGDRINIPEIEKKSIPCSTGQRHVFRVTSMVRLLKLAIEDFDGERLPNSPYELLVRGHKYEGTTDGDGILKQEIPLDAEEAKLTIDGHTWTLNIAHLNPVDDAPDEGVSGIQARLHNLGYNPGPIDGVAGPRTRAAVRSFQADNPPLEVDGICGPKTKAKLIERHGC